MTMLAEAIRPQHEISPEEIPESLRGEFTGSLFFGSELCRFEGTRIEVLRDLQRIVEARKISLLEDVRAELRELGTVDTPTIPESLKGDFTGSISFGCKVYRLESTRTDVVEDLRKRMDSGEIHSRVGVDKALRELGEVYVPEIPKSLKGDYTGSVSVGPQACRFEGIQHAVFEELQRRANAGDILSREDVRKALRSLREAKS